MNQRGRRPGGCPAQDLGPVPGGIGPVGKHLVPAEGVYRTRGRCAAGTRSAAAGLALTADHADLLQVAHGAGDRGRAGPEQPGELGGRQAARVGDQQGGEHPGRHRRNARLHEDGSEPLDERADRLLVAFHSLLRHREHRRSPAAPGPGPAPARTSRRGLPAAVPRCGTCPAGGQWTDVLNFHDFLNEVYVMKHDISDRGRRPGQVVRPDPRARRSGPGRRDR